MKNKPMEYKDESSIGIYNGKRIIQDKKIKEETLFDQKNNCVLDIEVENYNDDEREYEILGLINYKMSNIDKEKKVETLIIKPNKTKKCKIILNSKDFKYKKNSFAIVLRVDTKKHSSDNELVSTSTTIVRDFVVYNNKSTRENPLYSEKNEKSLQNNSKDDLEDTIINKKDCDNEYLVKRKPKEYIYNKLKLNNSIEYVIVCLEGANQADINGIEYIPYSGNADEVFKIKAPNEKGKHEVEFIALPNILVNENYDDNLLDEIRVHSSNRYTVEVK